MEIPGCKKKQRETYLVGGIPTPLKNMKVSWDYDIPNIWKNKTCSKPPTSHGVGIGWSSTMELWQGIPLDSIHVWHSEWGNDC